MIKRNIIESPARMPGNCVGTFDNKVPDQGRIHQPTYPYGADGGGPLTVHSILSPVDSRATRNAEYPRNDWLDVKHVRNSGG
jgi:hypothetical protein